MTRRRSAMLGVLVLGFVAAWMTGACGSNEPGPVDSCPTPADTPTDTSTECTEPMPKPCMRYRIPLVGNPSMDVALRSKYVVAFGSACYMSVANTFDCFYETWEEACADAKKIGEVSGNAPYKTNLVEVTPIKPGKKFYCSSGQVGADGMTLDQREWVLEVNRKAHGGEIHSDLAGFTWPCKDENCKPTMCTEKLVLKEPSDPPRL